MKPVTGLLRPIFEQGGPLSRRVPEYRVRNQQLDMAERVAEAMRDGAALLCEAGTGTGKTVAYLVPALLFGGKVIISTGTKTLQDQLFHRDLPMVREALGTSVTTALLKGRSNYVCHYHLERNLLEGTFASREDIHHLQAIASFTRNTQTGDKSEFGKIPEDAPAWGLATSTRESCLGQQCRNFADCFLMAARRQAQSADVVVVNHHLFFADVMLKDEGMAELLPACNTVILDEAHQLPQTATTFFGESVSTGQILELGRDARVAVATSARDVPALGKLSEAIEKSARDLRLALGGKGGRLAGPALEKHAGFQEALAGLEGALERADHALQQVAERDEGLARCAERAAELRERIARWREADAGETVRWAEAFPHALLLHATPLSIAGIFRKQIEARPSAWIFASATLAVSGDFSHYQAEMGLEEARTACWESPFDYARNALVCVPRGMPEPNTAEHTRAVIDRALPLIRASRGRAFLLFTTLRAMRAAFEELGGRLAAEHLLYPLLVQGEGSRSELLERFRRLGNAVLVASASFWEGVDVRGEALSLVVIDKLPFAPPDDPVLQARLALIEKNGRNAFLEYQLPHAAIALKQGTGRLIRDENDRGVLMICDPRLISRPYGRRLLASLPPMKLTRELGEAVAFFGAVPTPAATE